MEITSPPPGTRVDSLLREQDVKQAHHALVLRVARYASRLGENDAQVHAEICNGLSWLGVTFDASRNAAPGDVTGVIHDGASRCRCQVLASQEDEQIARHTWALLA